MKLALIGNSHLGAYRVALDDGYVLPAGTEITFFGAWGMNMGKIRVEGTRLVTDDETVRAQLLKLWQTDALDLNRFDAVALCGMHSAPRILEPLYLDYRLQSVSARHHLVSADTFRLAARGLLAKTDFGRLAREIRAAFSGLLVGLPQPTYAEHALRLEPKHWVAGAIKAGDDAWLANLLEELRGTLPFDLLVRQPSQTLASPLLTKRPFMDQGVKANRQTVSKEDVIHANGRYGAAVLDALFAVLPGTATAAPREAQMA